MLTTKMFSFSQFYASFFNKMKQSHCRLIVFLLLVFAAIVGSGSSANCFVNIKLVFAAIVGSGSSANCFVNIKLVFAAIVGSGSCVVSSCDGRLVSSPSSCCLLVVLLQVFLLISVFLLADLLLAVTLLAVLLLVSCLML